jgi:hypothetical protein
VIMNINKAKRERECMKNFGYRTGQINVYFFKQTLQIVSGMTRPRIMNIGVYKKAENLIVLCTCASGIWFDLRI